MIPFSLEEFAAKRRAKQDEAIAALLPLVQAWLADMENADLLDALKESVFDIYADIYKSEGGDGQPNYVALSAAIDSLVDKTKPDSEASLVATSLAVAAINAATMQAADEDPEPLVLEWVTMHDSAVRETHKDASGQQRPPGEPFDVGGEEMPYPGFPGVEPSLWINCRCSLAPALPNEFTKAGVEMTATETEQEVEQVTALPWHGVLAPEGVFSGDKRKFAEGSLTHRPLPLPLTWQKVSDDGHKGSVTVARIDRIERVDNEMRGSGVVLATVEADEWVGLLAEFGKFGVSVDADLAEFDYNEETGEQVFSAARIAAASTVPIPAFAEAWVALGEAPEGFMPQPSEEAIAASGIDWNTVTFTAGGLVFTPSQTSTTNGTITFDRGPGWITDPVATKRIHDYWTRPGEEGYAKIGWGKGGDFNRCRLLVGEKIAANSPEDLVFLNQICARWHKDALGIWPGEHLSAKDSLDQTEPAEPLTLVASAAGHAAPAEWFANPQFDKPTHLTITKEGRVFGHIAAWGTCHIGPQGMCITAPPSASDYAYFATGAVLLDDGTQARTGPITIGGGHADRRLRHRGAIEHYDNTCHAVADVAVGEDEHGIWCAGWIRPGTSDEDITALRASDVSGDWRKIGTNWEMVAALGVNTGGFSTPVQVAAANGEQISLVAAGIVQFSEGEQQKVNIDEIADRIAAAMERRAKERAEREEKKAALAARLKGSDD